MTTAGHIDVKLTITAQVADNEPIEVGTCTAQVPIHTENNGTLRVGSVTDAVMNALANTTCTDHRLVQHRDGKPPWCNTCKRTANGTCAQCITFSREIDEHGCGNCGTNHGKTEHPTWACPQGLSAAQCALNCATTNG